jgi:hypothetical protein
MALCLGPGSAMRRRVGNRSPGLNSTLSYHPRQSFLPSPRADFFKFRCPVGYYVGQVGDDKSSAFYRDAININRYNVWAAGALVGYDFGPVALNVWAVDEISAQASGGTPIGGTDSASIKKGVSVFGSLSYRIWAPDQSAVIVKRPQFLR